MKVNEVMSRDVCMANPSQTLREVAAEMEKRDIGVLPVADEDHLVGMITDRDIAIRGVSHGLGPDARVRDVMSSEVKYCFENDELSDLAYNMGDQRIRRLPVLNEQKRLVGIVSLGDLVACREEHVLAVALSGISRAGGPHNQTVAAPQ
jgi:CBS domain-containing protein